MSFVGSRLSRNVFNFTSLCALGCSVLLADAKNAHMKKKAKVYSYVKRVFLITHAFLSKMLLNRPPIWGGLLTNILHENAFVIRKTHFKFTYRFQKTKDFVKL